MGQIISTRPDLLPQDIIEELEKLQDTVPPFPFEEVRNVIESELGDSLENIYAKFDEKPLAQHPLHKFILQNYYQETSSCQSSKT